MEPTKTTLLIDDMKAGDKFFRVNQFGLDDFIFVGRHPKSQVTRSVVAIDGNNYSTAVVLNWDKDYYTTHFGNASKKFIQCTEKRLQEVKEIYQYLNEHP